jgi:hypothetical protein
MGLYFLGSSRVIIILILSNKDMTSFRKLAGVLYCLPPTERSQLQQGQLLTSALVAGNVPLPTNVILTL